MSLSISDWIVQVCPKLKEFWVAKRVWDDEIDFLSREEELYHEGWLILSPEKVDSGKGLILVSAEFAKEDSVDHLDEEQWSEDEVQDSGAVLVVELPEGLSFEEGEASNFGDEEWNS
jgi:hypothetical protein